MEDLEAKKWLNNDELAYKIWNNKYRYNNELFEEWLNRVSNNNHFVKEIIYQKKFIFGGRILANRGIKDKKVTYSNCYVITPPEDSIESIFECCSKLARTYSYGGGCGTDLSKLRPKGAIVNNAAKTTSGPVSFMELFSQTTGTICQAGRRGALMISMDINHPDIEEFIDIKTDLNKVNFANISVKVNDEFMKAVQEDKDYYLRFPCDSHIVYGDENYEYDKLYCKHNIYFKKVKAKRLFDKLVKNNWSYAEPGILYWNRISDYNLLDKSNFEYAGVNPCAEEPLPSGGSCLLGSINLSEFVEYPFTNKSTINWLDLENTIIISTLALNDVLFEGMNLHPLKEQQQSVSDWRQIGLGTMGLADMLIKLGVTYGSEESIDVINELYRFIASIAVKISLNLAKERSAFPKCDNEKISKSSFIENLSHNNILFTEQNVEDIRKFGLYNSQLLTCAPTGSIATMFGVSTGLEPIYAMKYTRLTKSLENKDVEFEVYTPIAEKYIKEYSKNLPEYFVESKDINPQDRIKVQSTIQKYVDASLSSTINLPKEATIEDVHNIYINAWKNGLKGVTIFRTGCDRAAILSTDKSKDSDKINRSAPKRPKDLKAIVEYVKVKGELFAVYTGFLNDKPYEIFARKSNDNIVKSEEGIITKKSKGIYSFKSENYQIDNLIDTLNTEEKAATLYTSMLLRHGINIKYIVKTTKKVNDNITSFCSAICRILSKYIPIEETGEKCPNCGSPIIKEGGCEHCSQCEWSRCMLSYNIPNTRKLNK